MVGIIAVSFVGKDVDGAHMLFIFGNNPHARLRHGEYVIVAVLRYRQFFAERRSRVSVVTEIARLVDLNALEGKATVNKVDQALRKCRAYGTAFFFKNVLDFYLGSGCYLIDITVARACDFLIALGLNSSWSDMWL